MRYTASFASLLALALATRLASAQAPSEAPSVAAPPPPGAAVGPRDEPDMLRYPPSSVRLPLVLGGLAFTLATYGGAAGLGAAFEDAQVPGADSLYIPLVGPFVALGRIGCSPNEPESCGELNALRGVLYVLDGLAQLGGLGIAAEGIFATTEATPARGSAASFEVVPLATGGMHGVGVVGRF